jgi:hypothetical protein
MIWRAASAGRMSANILGAFVWSPGANPVQVSVRWRVFGLGRVVS